MPERLETRNWKASDTGFLQTEGEINEVTVTGEVQTLNTGQHPVLKKAIHYHGRELLVLDLDVPPTTGTVGDIVSWKTITFTEKLRGVPKLHEVEIKGAVAHEEKVKVHRLQG